MLDVIFWPNTLLFQGQFCKKLRSRMRLMRRVIKRMTTKMKQSRPRIGWQRPLIYFRPGKDWKSRAKPAACSSFVSSAGKILISAISSWHTDSGECWVRCLFCALSSYLGHTMPRGRRFFFVADRLTRKTVKLSTGWVLHSTLAGVSSSEQV